MSQLVPSSGTCPRCDAPWSAAVFSSVDADTIPVQVEAILDGTFERRTCAGCGHAFRPEHPLLYASHARRLWVVMHPPSDRREFTMIEYEAERIIADNIAQAAPLARERLRGLRPRLVFGQHMLTEAVRAAQVGLEASLLECAKLFAVRRNLATVMAHGPFELCFERFDEAGAPVCAIHRLRDGERTGELVLARDILAEVVAVRAQVEELYPELFTRAYVSATRYLIENTL